MDKINNQWSYSEIISSLGASVYTFLTITYKSTRAGLIFISLLIYESMMCIVEAMLQVANPETDLRNSAVAVRVATIEKQNTPVISSAMRTTKIIALPAARLRPLPRSRTPEPTILIPEIVPFVSLEQTQSLPFINTVLTLPEASSTRTPSPELSQSSTSSKISINKMSTEEQPQTTDIPEPETPKTPPPTPAAHEQHHNGPTLAEIFKAFAKFGDFKSDGSTITLSNSDKWFKQAQLFDGKTMTTTDSGIYWKQVAKTKRSLHFSEYLKFLETLAKAKKLEVTDLKAKLKSSGPPSTSNATHAQSTGAFGRLTDHTKYTGSHRQRFDEAGKGRGKAGREDIIVNTGYVNGFKQ